MRYVEDDKHTPITLEEVRRANTRMGNGKSASDDGIPMEILRAGRVTVMEQLLKIFYMTKYLRGASGLAERGDEAHFEKKARKSYVIITEE